MRNNVKMCNRKNELHPELPSANSRTRTLNSSWKISVFLVVDERSAPQFNDSASRNLFPSANPFALSLASRDVTELQIGDGMIRVSGGEVTLTQLTELN